MKCKWFYRIMKLSPLWAIPLMCSLAKFSNIPYSDQELKSDSYVKLVDFYDNNNIIHSAFVDSKVGADLDDGYYVPKTVHVDLKQQTLRNNGSMSNMSNISQLAVAHICQNTYIYDENGKKIGKISYNTNKTIITPITHLTKKQYEDQQIKQLQYKLFCYDPNYNDPKLYYSSYIPMTKVNEHYCYKIGNNQFIRVEDIDLINGRPIVAQNIPCYIETFRQYGVIANAVVAQPIFTKQQLSKLSLNQYDHVKTSSLDFQNNYQNGAYYNKMVSKTLRSLPNYKHDESLFNFKHHCYPFTNYEKLQYGNVGIYATATHINMGSAINNDNSSANPYYNFDNLIHRRTTPYTLTCSDASNLMPAIYLKNSFIQSTVDKLNNPNSKYRYTQYALGAMAMYNLQPASKYFFNFNNGQIVNNYTFGSWKKPLSYNYSMSTHGVDNLEKFGLSIDKSALYKTLACGNQEIEQNHDWRTFFVNSGYYIQYPKELAIQNTFNRLNTTSFYPYKYDSSVQDMFKKEQPDDSGVLYPIYNTRLYLPQEAAYGSSVHSDLLDLLADHIGYLLNKPFRKYDNFSGRLDDIIFTCENSD